MPRFGAWRRETERLKARLAGRKADCPHSRLGVARGIRKLRYHCEYERNSYCRAASRFQRERESERKPLVIRIFAPRAVDPASVSFQVAPGTAVCAVEFDGIPDETLGDTYGADSLQALQLAADVEPVLKRLSNNYDFYFRTGEGYFDD